MAAAAIATFGALLSHVTAGGTMPGWVGILVPLVLSALVCVALVGTRLSWWRLTMAVGASQFLFHALFVLGAVRPSAAVPPGHDHMSGMAMPEAAPAMSSMSTVALMDADLSMWWGHAAAAVLTAVVLHRGERVVARLWQLAAQMVAWLHRVVLAGAGVVRPAAPRRLRSRIDVTVRTLVSVFLSAVGRRGPPAVRAV